MDFLTLAQRRYSVRKFTDQTIELKQLEKVIQAGRLAPTAVNYQPQRILILQSQESRKKVKQCTKFHFDAPVIFLICIDQEASWKRSYDRKDHGDMDAAIVATHMMLEATELGLGSTLVCHFDPEKTKQLFSLPSSYEPVAMLPMGYPAKDSLPNPNHEKRLRESETFFKETF